MSSGAGAGEGGLVAPKLGPMGEEGWFAVSGGSATPSIVARSPAAGGLALCGAAFRWSNCCSNAVARVSRPAPVSRVASNISRCMGWIMVMVFRAWKRPRRLVWSQIGFLYDNVDGGGC